MLRAELARRQKEDELARLKAALARLKIGQHIRSVYPDDHGRRMKVLEETVFDNEWIPEKYRAGLTLKQAEFLAYEGRECLFGGSAGGGKTAAALMGAAQYVHRPDYHALIIRRNFAQLEKAGAVMDVSKQWWYGKAKWNENKYKWTFPSGATVEFGHMDGPNAHFNFQGAVWTYCVFDELTQFPDFQQYTFLFTRLRREAGSDLPIRMRATSNPGGPGHQSVYKRFIDAKTKTADAHFIPAKLDDNPNLDRAEYIAGMAEIDPVTRAQMLEGDWNAVKGGRFLREWFRYHRREGGQLVLYDAAGEVVERFDPDRQPRWMTCDPAAGTSESADHFVLSTWCLSPKANLVWLHCHRARHEIPEQVAVAKRLYRRFAPQFVAVEEVLNQRALAQLLRRSTDPPMIVHGVSPLGKKKIERATPAIVFVSSGRLYLPEDDRTFPLDEVEGELVRFTGEDGNPDDCADTLFYSVQCLNLVAPYAGGSEGYLKPAFRDPTRVDAAEQEQRARRFAHMIPAAMRPKW